MSDWDTISKIRARYDTRNHRFYTGSAVQPPHVREAPILATAALRRTCKPIV